jgi:hypothetical protein
MGLLGQFARKKAADDCRNLQSLALKREMSWPIDKFSSMRKCAKRRDITTPANVFGVAAKTLPE